MAKALIFDTETTGLDNPEIIEAAWIMSGSVYDLKVDPFYLERFEKRFSPEGKISFGAMATHHIVGDDLVCCDASSSFSLLDTLSHGPDDGGPAEYLVGHNVDFDWKAAGCPDLKRTAPWRCVVTCGLRLIAIAKGQ